MTNYIKNGIWEKRKIGLFYLAVFVIILLSIFYLYRIALIVAETANHQGNLQNLIILKREYQELEKNYLSSLARLNLEYAYSLGFVNFGAVSFVSRRPPVAQNKNEAFR
jgi:hypothetical protein